MTSGAHRVDTVKVAALVGTSELSPGRAPSSSTRRRASASAASRRSRTRPRSSPSSTSRSSDLPAGLGRRRHSARGVPDQLRRAATTDRRAGRPRSRSRSSVAASGHAVEVAVRAPAGEAVHPSGAARANSVIDERSLTASMPPEDLLGRAGVEAQHARRRTRAARAPRTRVRRDRPRASSSEAIAYRCDMALNPSPAICGKTNQISDWSSAPAQIGQRAPCTPSWRRRTKRCRSLTRSTRLTVGPVIARPRHFIARSEADTARSRACSRPKPPRPRSRASSRGRRSSSRSASTRRWTSTSRR